MSAAIIPLFRTIFDPIRIEITSPGTQGGRRFYFVDYVESNGGRAGMWSGFDFDEARQAAHECAGGEMPVVDFVGAGQARH